MSKRDSQNPDGRLWEDLVGKYILVGITRQDSRGAELGNEQVHGRVIASDPRDGLALRLEGSRAGDLYSLPPDLRSLQPAAPGDYRLRSTGETIKNPDFVATWLLVQRDS